MRNPVLSLLAFSAFLASTAWAEPASVSAARRALRRGDPPDVSWKYSQRIDINDDGEMDFVFTGSDSARFYVAAVIGPPKRRSQYSVVAFSLSGGSQDAFCGSFESLKSERLSTHVREALGELPRGYRPSQTGKGLRLQAGECDSFHLFWDHVAEGLSWWRL